MTNINKILDNFTFLRPRVLRKKGGKNIPSSFSFNEIPILNKPLREIRTGERFIPRRERLFKERVLTRMLQDTRSKNKFKSASEDEMNEVNNPRKSGYIGFRVNMSPNKFIKLAQTTELFDNRKHTSQQQYENNFNQYYNKEMVDNLKLGLLSNKKVVPAPFIEFYKGKIYNADGRHRALYAKELKINPIPVNIVETDKSFIKKSGDTLFSQFKNKKEINPDKESEEMVLYHGTKLNKLEAIKKHGLVPQKTHWRHEKTLFFTPFKSRAEYHANKGQSIKKFLKQPYENGVVLKVDVPDNLIPKINEVRKTKNPLYDVQIHTKIPPQNIISYDVSKDYIKLGKYKEKNSQFFVLPSNKKDIFINKFNSEDINANSNLIHHEELHNKLNKDFGEKTSRMLDNISEPLLYVDDKDVINPLSTCNIMFPSEKIKVKNKMDDFVRDVDGKLTPVEFREEAEKRGIINDVSKNRNLQRCFQCGGLLEGKQSHYYRQLEFCSGECARKYIIGDRTSKSDFLSVSPKGKIMHTPYKEMEVYVKKYMKENYPNVKEGTDEWKNMSYSLGAMGHVYWNSPFYEKYGKDNKSLFFKFGKVDYKKSEPTILLSHIESKEEFNNKVLNNKDIYNNFITGLKKIKECGVDESTEIDLLDVPSHKESNIGKLKDYLDDKKSKSDISSKNNQQEGDKKKKKYNPNKIFTPLDSETAELSRKVYKELKENFGDNLNKAVYIDEESKIREYAPFNLLPEDRGQSEEELKKLTKRGGIIAEVIDVPGDDRKEIRVWNKLPTESEVEQTDEDYDETRGLLIVNWIDVEDKEEAIKALKDQFGDDLKIEYKDSSYY